MTIGISIKGTKEAIGWLKGKNKKLVQAQEDSIIKATLYVQGEVKESIAGNRTEPTSVDTGRFLNSVNVMTSDEDGVVFTDIPYAKYLEYGTSQITARKHFGNTAKRTKTKVKEIIKEEVKKATSY